MLSTLLNLKKCCPLATCNGKGSILIQDVNTYFVCGSGGSKRTLQS